MKKNNIKELLKKQKVQLVVVAILGYLLGNSMSSLSSDQAYKIDNYDSIKDYSDSLEVQVISLEKALYGESKTVEGSYEKNEEITNEPLITIDDLAFDFKDGYVSNDTHEIIYTITNKSNYTISAVSITFLQPSSNEKTYVDAYDVLFPGEKTSNRSFYPDDKLENLEMLNYSITLKGEADNSYYIEYDAKLDKFHCFGSLK